MYIAEQLAPIGDQLVVLARDFTDDTNEAYLIAHKALRTLLRSDAPVSELDSNKLRDAVSLAAATMGIAGREQRESFNPAAWIWPERPDLVL